MVSVGIISGVSLLVGVFLLLIFTFLCRWNNSKTYQIYSFSKTNKNLQISLNPLSWNDGCLGISRNFLLAEKRKKMFKNDENDDYGVYYYAGDFHPRNIQNSYFDLTLARRRKGWVCGHQPILCFLKKNTFEWYFHFTVTHISRDANPITLGPLPLLFALCNAFKHFCHLKFIICNSQFNIRSFKVLTWYLF